MNCEECLKNLIFLAHQEMEIENSIPYYEHLADCESCSQEYQLLLETICTVENELCPNDQLSLGDEKLTHLQNLCGKNSAPKKFPFWIYSVAASLAITFIGILIYQKQAIPQLHDEVKNSLKINSDENLPKPEEEPGLNAVKISELKNESLTLEDNGIKNEPDKVNSKEFKKSDRLKKQNEVEATAAAEINTASAPRSRDAKVASDSLAEQSFTNSIGAVPSPVTVASLKKLLSEAVKSDDFDESTKNTINQLLTENDWTISTLPEESEKSEKEKTEKFLLKKQNITKNPIDFALIFIHNGKIIKFEKLK